MLVLRRRYLPVAADANHLSEKFILRDFHPERSEGSGGVETSTVLRGDLAHTDVSLCSTWKRSVVPNSPADIYLRQPISSSLLIFEK
jgi:hypothetical protein